MLAQTSLFQTLILLGSNPATDSRVRKTLKAINLKSGPNLGLRLGYLTFYDFRRSGATFAFNAHVPIQEIKRHGTWSSESVWAYIWVDYTSGEALANALASLINNA